MRNKVLKKLENDDYENYCNSFNEFFLKSQKNNKKISNKIKGIFPSLIENYEKIHKKENYEIKKISENNKKIIINATYISKIIDNDDNIDYIKIHDYDFYLYSDNVVKEIEDNVIINKDFKKIYNNEFVIKQEEVNDKYNEICIEKNIDTKNYENLENPIKNDLKNNNFNINIKKCCKCYDYDFYSFDCYYYKIILDINSLENLNIYYCLFYYNSKVYKKYKQIIFKNVVSIIGSKNKGKSFILKKLNNKSVYIFIIMKKGIIVIYHYYNDDVAFFSAAVIKISLCENKIK